MYGKEKKMKKKLNRLLSYSVYRKAMLLYALSIVLLTAAILASLFGVVTYFVKSWAADNSKLLLNQLVSTSEYIKTDVNNLLSVVANSTSTQNFVRSKRDNKTTNYYLFLDLNSLKSSYSYVVDLSVVNLETMTSVQTTGTNVNYNANYYFAESMLEKGDLSAARKIFFNNPVEEHKVVSFLYSLPYSSSAVIVDVDIERFNLAISENSEISRQVIILDKDGEDITSPEQSPIAELEEGYLADIVTGQNQDVTSLMIDDSTHKIILFFSRSNTLGWWFVDVQGYSRFYSTYQTITLIFLGLALAFLILCILLSFLFSKRMRQPLIELVEKCKASFGKDIESEDEIKYLDQAIASVEHERFLSDNYVQSLYLQRVLLGRDIPFFLSREKQLLLQERYLAPHYCVILLQIQLLYKVEPEHMIQEMNLLRYTVCNLAQDIFGAEYRCITVDLGDDLSAVILQLEKRELGEEYLLCFKNLKEFGNEQIRIQLSGSVGTIVNSFDDLRSSCAKARQYLNLGSIVGKGDIIDSNQAANATYQEKNRKLVESVVDYTRQNYSDPDLSLKGLSQKFGLSTTYLGKIFKSIQGESYSAFVTAYRLEQSKLALLETTKTVNEISAEVGFANPTYFATVFKSTYGMTPTAFRNGAT